MSEFQIFPVPKEDDYLNAVLELSAEAEKLGGMNAYLRDYEYRGASGESERIQRHIKAAGAIALRLEPKSDKMVVYDRMFMAITHSFKRGLITGTKLTDIAHGQLIPDALVLHRLDKGIRSTVVMDEDGYVDGLGMIPWGQLGLDTMGEDATSFLTDMANDVYERPEHRALYKLGAGAAILTAHCLVVDENLTSVKRYFHRYDPSKELGELIDSTTGE